jgi:hypothetical protein
MLKMPTWASAALSAIAGVLAVLNQVTVPWAAGSDYKSYVTVALIFLGGLGISPLLGSAFKNVLHLPLWVSAIITSGLAAAGVAVQITSMSNTPKAIIEFAIAFGTGLGFGPITSNSDALVSKAKHA